MVVIAYGLKMFGQLNVPFSQHWLTCTVLNYLTSLISKISEITITVFCNYNLDIFDIKEVK